MAIADVAWAAGLFEGEGCLTLHHNTGHRYLAPRVYLVTTDLDVLQRFQGIVGYGRILTRRLTPTMRRTQYEWSVGTFEEFQFVVALFWRWLGDRRRARAAEVLLEMRAYYRTVAPRRPRRLVGHFSAYDAARAAVEARK